MTQDHYAILGVKPTAEPAVIRAAYLALMREYHPDRNPSPAAVERAQAIIAAFKELGDFDRRNHYDWDQRREREKAQAALVAAPPRRKLGAGAIAAGSIGLAAIAALLMRPDSTPAPAPPPANSPVLATRKAPSAPVRRATPARIASRDKVEQLDPVKPAKEPVRVAMANPVVVKLVKKERIKEREPVVRVATTEPVRRRAKEAVARLPMSRQAMVVKPPPQSRMVAKPGASTDLASLDQFVMSFYGQSWRFGDAKKRAALGQSRDSFVVRHGACAADACKRAAYLKLMRDVSEISETGQAR